MQKVTTFFQNVIKYLSVCPKSCKLNSLPRNSHMKIKGVLFTRPFHTNPITAVPEKDN